MPNSFTCLYVHVIFSTKDRKRWILSTWRERLHHFLGAVVHDRDAIAVSIGGVADHVHLLLRLKPIHALSDLVREIKSVSSKWVHDEKLESAFAWQDGYGAFSVSPNAVEAVTHYIEHQEEHHRVRTAEEEFREFLKRAGFDPSP